MEDKNLDRKDKENIEESIVKIIIDLINKVIETAKIGRASCRERVSSPV